MAENLDFQVNFPGDSTFLAFVNKSLEDTLQP